jgi:hypothetical protein
MKEDQIRAANAFHWKTSQPVIFRQDKMTTRSVISQSDETIWSRLPSKQAEAMKLNIAKTPQTVPCLSAVASGSDYQPCQPVDRKSILIMTILGSSLAFMDGSVVNVALPTFQTTFYATSSEVQWVVQSYALFCAALLLLGGMLGDRLGRKRTFQDQSRGLELRFSFHSL